ncbi:MAG: autotransporter domain-containing protein, partial [Chlamydiales bacterium]
LTATPLYFRNDMHKDSSIPNYVQNSGGVRVSYDINYPTFFQPTASISYIHTHTNWGDHRGNADSNAVYIDVGIGYSMKGFLASLALLGGYSYTDATHNLSIGYPIKAMSTPHSWDVAESLSLQYTHIYRSIAIIPRIVLTQTNIYLSSICEDKPKGLNLQTDAKYFGFLDTLVSLRIQGKKTHCYCCVKPYVDLGWHNSSHLSNREFHSRLDHYTSCACSFSTKTYCGSANRFFMEWGIAFSFMNNIDLLINSRTEMTKGDFIQAVNFGASWRF